MGDLGLLKRLHFGLETFTSLAQHFTLQLSLLKKLATVSKTFSNI